VALGLIAVYCTRDWWRKQLTAVRGVPDRWEAVVLATGLTLCVIALLLNVERSTQRCFDDKGYRYTCSLPVTQLLQQPSFQDALGWFRTILLLFPFVGCLLHVPFPAIATLHTLSTGYLMSQIYLHPSRFEVPVVLEKPLLPPSGVNATTSSLTWGSSYEEKLTTYYDPHTPSAIRLILQHGLPSVLTLIIVYLFSRQRLQLFVAARKLSLPKDPA